MNQLSEFQIQRLKTLLLENKHDLEEHFELNSERDRDGQPLSQSDSTGELSGYDNHPADSGTETFERGRDQALDESLGRKLAQVNLALTMMEDGSYGICAACGEPIPFERLEAMPSTRYCIKHTPRKEPAGDRPVEEQVMTAPPSGAGESRQAHAGHFDEADAWSTVEKYGNSSDTVPAEPQSSEALNEVNKL
ncbi:TraR/DksA C4-type zinc finger protein [Paenibacillus beijingensis]|uniref:Conjugal transfer protein TraR n=1 Tax=Paenibacillus beijingensis TaxID=1126833 RepID=A0A0D5NN62_9BACL|nr:TraR/DksA C4-type zinc finger protein [Paenibacillus beijingensis]AJY76696.1 conjugal transfer protein TraR [Paenibacillus beijingensis]